MKLRGLVARGDRPFPSYPQCAQYFPAAAIEDARRRLTRAIDRGDGPGLVVGSAGTGKSLLLQVLAAQYHERFDVVLLACAQICTRRALLQAILFELGLPYHVRDEGQLRLSLLDHLLSAEHNAAGLLLLVDEAQSLSAALLDELRVMTNLVRGGAPRVRLVLAGSSSLEESFASPQLESLSQRLAARCYLSSMSRQETVQFVRAQIAAVGASPESIFANDAWEAIFEATDGVPRLINQLCDRALLQADVQGLAMVDRSVIQTVWAELQQLPLPYTTPSPGADARPTSVVEFGGLQPESVAGDIEDEQETQVQSFDLEESATAFTADEAPLERACDSTDSDQPHSASISAVWSKAPPTENCFAADQPESVSDPFAEQFAEEEIVIDSFASWDDMFHLNTPRVHNGRNRDFAGLVQEVLDASPLASGHEAERLVLEELELADEDEERVNEENADEGHVARGRSSLADTDGRWPPIRLAVVAEPVPLRPISLMAPAPAKQRPAELEEAPVLVIEEDFEVTSPVPAPPVRREEYRHLFSRLRSG